MSWFEVAASMLPDLAEHNFSACEARVADALRALPASPFHAVLDVDFANAPEEVAAVFDAFVVEQAKQIRVAAVYTETNGFDINPDLWYCDLFAFSQDGGLDDPDWLCEWQSSPWPPITLTGMESLQEVYENNELGSEAAYTASLMVVVKFQKLIWSSKQHVAECTVPVYATGHEYDFFAKC